MENLVELQKELREKLPDYRYSLYSNNLYIETSFNGYISVTFVAGIWLVHNLSQSPTMFVPALNFLRDVLGEFYITNSSEQRKWCNLNEFLEADLLAEDTNFHSGNRIYFWRITK